MSQTSSIFVEETTKANTNQNPKATRAEGPNGKRPCIHYSITENSKGQPVSKLSILMDSGEPMTHLPSNKFCSPPYCSPYNSTTTNTLHPLKQPSKLLLRPAQQPLRALQVLCDERPQHGFAGGIVRQRSTGGGAHVCVNTKANGTERVHC